MGFIIINKYNNVIFSECDSTRLLLKNLPFILIILYIESITIALFANKSQSKIYRS